MSVVSRIRLYLQTYLRLYNQYGLVEIQKERSSEPILDSIEFCQIFALEQQGEEELTLGVESVVLCPDETAIIRVMSNDIQSKRYKRKVSRDKANNRYFMFNGQRVYLDDKKTKPRISYECM